MKKNQLLIILKLVQERALELFKMIYSMTHPSSFNAFL